MRFSTIITLFVILSLDRSVQVNGKGRGGKRRKGCDPEDVQVLLGVGLPSDSTIDVYFCKDNGNRRQKRSKDKKKSKNLLPLVVFSSGGNVRKTEYSIAGREFASKGYVVMVLEHMVEMMHFELNMVNPLDMRNAIDYAETQTDFDVDTESVFLSGHSNGAAQTFYALNSKCEFPFCGAPGNIVDVPLHPSVKGVAVYGTTLVNFIMHEFEPFLHNNGFPFLIVMGSGDQASFSNTTNGENHVQGTFDRMTPKKVIATIDGLDHYSIADLYIPSSFGTPRKDILSDFPRETQVRMALEPLHFWIQKELDRHDDNTNFCEELEERGEEESRFLRGKSSGDFDITFTVTQCLEQYA